MCVRLHRVCSISPDQRSSLRVDISLGFSRRYGVRLRLGQSFARETRTLRAQRDSADRLDEVDHSPSASAMKNQVVGLIAAVAYLRGPLIVLNSLTCVIAMLP